MSKMKYLACIAFVLLNGFAFPAEVGAAALSPADKPADVTLEGYKPQLAQGRSSEIRAFGKSFPIQSVEVTPPDGITIGEIKEGVPDPKNLRQKKEGVKVWSIPLTVSKTAQVGERSVVFVTPEGRSEAKPFLVVTHRPVIKTLDVLSTNSSGAEVKVKITVADEAGDVGPEPSVGWMLMCGGTGVMGSTFLTEIPGGLKTTVITTTLSQTGSYASGVCDFEVTVTDSKGNESPAWTRKLEFK